MKELSKEEKAQAYDKAIERTSKLIDEGCLNKMTGEFIFPELAESEDERIRKTLVAFFTDWHKTRSHCWGISVLKILAWFENQGEQIDLANKEYWRGYREGKQGILDKYSEQKPTDKVEPKFKIGDWIVCCDYEPEQIIGIRANAYYEMSNGDSRPFYMIDNNHNIRLWTLTDAKDGDVLVASDGSIFIFESVVDCACKHYVALTTDGAVKFNEGLEHFWETSTAVHPSTKEQCDLLFQKMKEAGYEWNAEKKELKNIEQKQEWSKDDEEYYDAIIAKLEVTQEDAALTDNQMNFLKSLKERLKDI